MWAALKNVPILGSVLETIEILQNILTNLYGIMTTLKAAEKKAKAGGSISKAILGTIAAGTGEPNLV